MRGGASRLARTPRAESSISARSRNARVSGRFAETTQWVIVRRHPGGCAAKNLHAEGDARNAARSPGANPTRARSNE
jgi:hypothetical protein